MNSNMSKQKRDELSVFLRELKENFIDDYTLIKINELEKFLNEKKYGLVWEEHSEKIDIVLKENIPVFQEIQDKEITSISNESYNFILEGDNLHSLYLLQKTHKEKIDMIYIDPPYNTGNKDFKYNDEFVNREDEFKHSKWLSFMQKRLRIARTLLSNNGAIFISIDDYEYAPLKMLCDEIFGERNLVTSMIWQRKTGASDAKGIATITEYVLVYTKNSDKNKWSDIFTQNYESYDIKRYRKKDKFFNERGPYYPDNLDRGGLQYSDSMNYAIKCPDGTYTYPNGRTTFENDGWTWKWSKETVKWGIENDFIEFEKSSSKASGWSVRYKNYLKVDNKGNIYERSAPFKNLILNKLNTEGNEDLKKILGTKKFNNPKPVSLIKHLISLINNDKAIILDFFAGSGTTGQAVLEMNKLDNGKRKFILCTNNENNICETVTYPRIKKLIQGYEYKGKTERILLNKKINVTLLKNIKKVFEEIENIKINEEDNYINFKLKINKGELLLLGEWENNGISYPIESNLKYYKTDYVSRYIDKDYYLSDDLMIHIKEMIQLEHHKKIDHHKYLFIINEDIKDEYLEKHLTNNTLILYKASHIFLDSLQEKKVIERNINVINIPEYYFINELREVGEA